MAVVLVVVVVLARARQHAAGPRRFPIEGDGEKLRFAFFGTLRDLCEETCSG